jgi:hypothetical protein
VPFISHGSPRRLKRIGAGTAVAWTSPVLLSLRTPAFAASPECTQCRAFDCVEPFPRCRGECACILTTENDCFCAGPILCGFGCNSSGDCAPGYRCVVFTCDPCGPPVRNLCANPCP